VKHFTSTRDACHWSISFSTRRSLIRLRAIDLRPQVRGKSREVRLHAVAFHIFDAHAIDAGASSVCSRLRIQRQ
jgi:hypothetical protein